MLIAIIYTIWLFVGIVCLGIGPATAVIRARRVPLYLWLPVSFLMAAVASYGVWLAYVVHPGAGRRLAMLWLVASVASFMWMIARGRDAAALRSALLSRDAWMPGALMLALTITYLCVLSSRAASPNDRFTWGLPPDNDIPRLVAARMEVPPAVRPRGFLLGDWLVSDRPPLQAGVVLAVKPFDYGQYPMLTYQIVGTICQMGWVLAIYALARTIGLSRRQTIYVLAACATSGFFLVHSVYVWPKLLSAWLFLIAVVVMFCLAKGEVNVHVGWNLIAGAVALSALAHGGALFSFLALPLLVARLRLWRRLAVLPLVTSAAIALMLIGPWVAYQRMVDPPGDRLPKMHLAGVGTIDQRGLARAIVEEYGTLSMREYLRGRLLNLTAQVSLDKRAPDETAADWTRRQQFFHHAATLDFLLIGLAGLLPLSRRSHRTDDRLGAGAATDLRSLALFALATVVVWALLMFTPGSAIVHHGSFAATTLLFFCAAAGLARWPAWLVVSTLLAHCGLFAWAWLITQQVSMMSGVASPWQPAYIAAAVISSVAFVALLALIPRDAAPTMGPGWSELHAAARTPRAGGGDAFVDRGVGREEDIAQS